VPIAVHDCVVICAQDEDRRERQHTVSAGAHVHCGRRIFRGCEADFEAWDAPHRHLVSRTSSRHGSRSERNAMKTDAQLKKDVQAELEWDPSINAAHVGVAVQEGVVTLSGHLGSFAEKVAVERAAKRVAGVRGVAVELDVKLEPHHHVSDAEIAAAVQTAFKWHALIPEDRIHFTVEKGWVTLTGMVDWEHQRHNAEVAVRPLTGVLGVVNKIHLRAREAPNYVAHRIHEALARYADDEARHIEVLVDGGTATLRGTVNSWAEHAVVQNAAWLAPGIQRVFNDLKVLS
jgi:osmotically-inducible protein OsmY